MMTSRIINSIVRESKITSLVQNKSDLVCRKFLSSLSFASPRNLNDILKLELIEDKSTEEIKRLWSSYHEDKERTIGFCCAGDQVKNILERAKNHSFLIQPVFREGGFFNLCSQFQTPRYFMFCMLEDYQQNPAGANALVTLSVFDDLVDEHNIGLLRGDIINNGISEVEGEKVIKSVFDAYTIDDTFNRDVFTFNKEPESFDFNDYISRQKQKWEDD